MYNPRQVCTARFASLPSKSEQSICTLVLSSSSRSPHDDVCTRVHGRCHITNKAKRLGQTQAWFTWLNLSAPGHADFSMRTKREVFRCRNLQKRPAQTPQTSSTSNPLCRLDKDIPRGEFLWYRTSSHLTIYDQIVKPKTHACAHVLLFPPVAVLNAHMPAHVRASRLRLQ